MLCTSRMRNVVIRGLLIGILVTSMYIIQFNATEVRYSISTPLLRSTCLVSDV